MSTSSKNRLNFRYLLGFLISITLCTLFTSSALGIEYISYVGAEIDSGARWLRSSVPKTLTTDNRTVYGTNTAIHWQIYGRYSGTEYVNVNGRQYNKSNYAEIDKINTASYESTVTATAGIKLFDTQIKFTEDFDRVRLGVMYDVLGTETDSTHTQVFNVYEVGNTSNSSGTITLVTENDSPDIYFFDLVNVKANDVFNINAYSSTGRSGYSGPIMIDVIPATETNNGQWNISFTNKTATNYLDISKTAPARSLRDTDETWTAAVVRLDGTSAGNHPP
ncbi:MAG: hypothetical protein Q4C96_03750 [Planctomycetia bacterium]|nr:hypothetical protein [Planctomycetia bacterium]